MVPRSQVMVFWEELDAVGADWHFHSYAGVRHGFTDPASDTRGMAAVASRSNFFAESFTLACWAKAGSRRLSMKRRTRCPAVGR